MLMLAACGDVYVNLGKSDTAEDTSTADGDTAADTDTDTDTDTEPPTGFTDWWPGDPYPLENGETGSRAHLFRGDFDADGNDEVWHLVGGGASVQLNGWETGDSAFERVGSPTAPLNAHIATGVDFFGIGTSELVSVENAQISRMRLSAAGVSDVRRIESITQGVWCLLVDDYTGDGVDDLAWHGGDNEVVVVSAHGTGVLRRVASASHDPDAATPSLVNVPGSPARLLWTYADGQTEELSVDLDSTTLQRVSLGVVRTESVRLEAAAVLDTDGDGDRELVTQGVRGPQAWDPTDGGIRPLRDGDGATELGVNLWAGDLEGDGDTDLLELETLRDTGGDTIRINAWRAGADGLGMIEEHATILGPEWAWNPWVVMDVDGDRCVDIVLLDELRQPWLLSGQCQAR